MLLSETAMELYLGNYVTDLVANLQKIFNLWEADLERVACSRS